MNIELLQIDPEETSLRFRTGPLLSMLIAAGGIDEASVRELLEGNTELTVSSAECVQKCCGRIMEAKRNGEKIFVGGDYDADGICATAIMKKTLDRLGIANGYYIPDRFKEGYGLSPATVQAAFDKGYGIIMTVDNGVRAHEALRLARRLGMSVIVTDHHRIDEEIEADIVVHPDYMEEQYGTLSGAGVALQISRMLTGNDDRLTALAAVAAIADVMPLWKETRRIVLKGLQIMRTGRPRPLTALLYSSEVSWTSVAFQIVPKLNSVGRMNDLSNVNTVVRYLLLEDDDQITRYCAQLNHVNDVRKQLSSSMTKDAEKLCTGRPFEIVYRADFHEGICGLAAGRLANTLHRPVLVMADAGELIKGSGRSVPGFDMFAFFSDFEELAAFGGHEQAVGISVRKEDFESFCAHVDEKMRGVQITEEGSSLRAVVVNDTDITFENISELERIMLLPKEMSSILFAVQDPEIVKRFESPKVTKLTFRVKQGTADAVIYASKGLQVPEQPHLIAGRFSINRWRNSVTCQIEADYVE